MGERKQDLFWAKGKGKNEAQIISPDADEPYEGEGWEIVFTKLLGTTGSVFFLIIRFRSSLVIFKEVKS